MISAASVAARLPAAAAAAAGPRPRLPSPVPSRVAVDVAPPRVRGPVALPGSRIASKAPSRARPPRSRSNATPGRRGGAWISHAAPDVAARTDRAAQSATRRTENHAPPGRRYRSWQARPRRAQALPGQGSRCIAFLTRSGPNSRTGCGPKTIFSSPGGRNPCINANVLVQVPVPGGTCTGRPWQA